QLEAGHRAVVGGLPGTHQPAPLSMANRIQERRTYTENLTSSAMESFFALLQKNVLNRQHWATREQLRIAIVTWIERTYHRRRRQARLGRFTPIEYETIINTAASAA
ncbi:IS3 family transposase, partial [Tsukamurella spumae]